MTEPWLASGVIAVVRLPESAGLRGVATALAAGGVAVEITLTTPGALEVIADLASHGGGCVVGAGTVLDEKGARDVIAAGAQFVVSPMLDRSVVRYCKDQGVTCLPGAFTPTELLEAWRAGAPLVKLFPASALGPRYLREVLAPLPFLRVVPSGGVSLDNAGDWIRAGAAAVSVGSALVSKTLVVPPLHIVERGTGGEDAWAELTARARALVECVAAARGPVAGAPA
jgi:2-dehydro-3-deoxyphosphogluconate aldolase/(4S)-4-hydroxy-2-oxoglutarate aldolase